MSTRDPIKLATDMIDECLERSPYFLVSISGGKDGNAVAQLAGERIKLFNEKNPARPAVMRFFYKYLVQNIRCVERPIHLIRERFNVPTLYDFPGVVLGKALQVGFMRDISLNGMDAIQVKEVDIDWAARMTMACELSGIARDKMWRFDPVADCGVCGGKGEADVKGFEHLLPVDLLLDNGKARCFACQGKGKTFKREPTFGPDDLKVDPHAIWIAGGHKQCDSLERRAWLSSMSTGRGAWRGMGSQRIGLDYKSWKCYPVAEWSDREIHAYGRYKKIPPPASLGKASQGGLDLSVRCMQWLWDHARDDYWRTVEMFPLAHGLAKRDEATPASGA